MEKNEIQKRILEEEDYIRCPKCSNSINKFLSKNPEGTKDSVIAKLLMVSEEKIKELWKEAAKLLRKDMED